MAGRQPPPFFAPGSLYDNFSAMDTKLFAPVTLPLGVPVLEDPLCELEILDVFADPSPSTSIKVAPTDAQGFLSMPCEGPYNVEHICRTLHGKVTQNTKNWVDPISNGLILKLGLKNNKTNIEYIPYHIAIDFLVSMIAQKNKTGAPSTILGSKQPLKSEYEHFEFYEWTLALLVGLQKITQAPSLILVRHSANTQSKLLEVLLRAMSEAIHWLSNHQKEVNEYCSTTAKGKKKGDIHSIVIRMALHTFTQAATILSTILGMELKIFTSHHATFLKVGQKSNKKIRFPLEWFPMALQETVIAKYSLMVVQMISLVTDLDMSKGKEISLWDTFNAIFDVFYFLCASDHYVQYLISTRTGTGTGNDIIMICEGFATLLEKIKGDLSLKAHNIRYHILRVLTVLCEKKNPNFLDFLGTMPCSHRIAFTIIEIASQIVGKVAEAADGASTEGLDFMAPKEAYRVMELMSKDNKFIPLVIDEGCYFLLQFLSIPSEVFVMYLESKDSLQEYVSLVLFRIIAHLHHYDPETSPPTQEGKLLRTIVGHCSTMFTVGPDGKGVVQQKLLITPHIMGNLFYLFQRVSFIFTSTCTEQMYWQSFIQAIEAEFDIKYPTFKTSFDADGKSTGKPGRPRLTSNPVEHFPVQSTLLQGLSVSLARVSNMVELRNMIRSHSGNVLEYVSKTVTHVICATDNASIALSQPKIQSAASKQIPAVSEQFILDSVAKGRLLSERSYLVSDHPYKKFKHK